MADIELVIKMPDEMYKWVNDVNKSFDDYGTSDFIDLVKNGTPLPKGLIDTDKVQEKINKLLKEPDYQHEGEDWKTGLIMAEELIVDSLTIIESEE